MGIVDSEAWRNKWFSFSAPYGRPTGDRRQFAVGALDHRSFPMPLCLQIQSAAGHMGSVVVGSIDEFTSVDSGVLTAGEWLDPDAVPEVRRAIELVRKGLARPSVDLEPGTVTAEVTSDDAGRSLTLYHHAVVYGMTIVPVAAFDGTFVRMAEIERLPVNDTGDDEPGREFALTMTRTWKTLPIAARETVFNSDDSFKRILAWANGSDEAARSMFLWFDPDQAEGTRDRYRLPLGDIVGGRPNLTYHAVYSASALISGAHGGLPTVSDQEKARMKEVISGIYSRMSGAFGDPNMMAPWDARAKSVDNSRTASVVASSAPVKPPAQWFADPKLVKPTPFTVLESGRVFGHLALWDVCHVGLGQLTGECVKAPRSSMNYSLFKTGKVLVDNGDVINVGRITVDTTHPVGSRGAALTAASASQHYDNTGSCAAVVNSGEDKWGIWFSGSVVPEATEQDRAKLRRHPLSGDWRRHNGNLELVAALSVNSPGFPIVSMNNGERFTLVASIGPCDMMDDMTVETGEQDPVVEPAVTETAVTETAPPAPMISPADIGAMVAKGIQEHREMESRVERLATLATIPLSERLGRLNSLPTPGGK